MVSTDVTLRCDCHAEAAVFSAYEFKDEINYELSIEDSYCGGDFMGIKGRFKRAWRAFFAKPIYYSSVYVEDGAKMKKFLEDALALIKE